MQKILAIENEYITTADYYKFTKDIVVERIKNIIHLVKDFDLNKKVVTLATKAELKAEQDKIINLEALDSSYFCGKCHFEDNGTQNCLMF